MMKMKKLFQLDTLFTKLGYYKKEYLKHLQKENEVHLEKYNRLLHTNGELHKLLDQKQRVISAMSKEAGEQKHILAKIAKDRKRLLTKYRKVKEQVKILSERVIELESELTNTKTKVTLLNTYNNAVLSKLEYICFGSILPKVMKQIDLSIYLYPIKTIKKQFIETKDGLKLRATEYESND